MKFVIDTSSLLSLVRYYLPFDDKKFVYQFVKEQIEASNIKVLDCICLESENVAEGLIIDKFPFIKEKKNHTKTAFNLPDKKFFETLDKDCTTYFRGELNDREYEFQKKRFLESGDGKLLLHSYRFSGHIIVTEETFASNDKKIFKKLPAICKAFTLPSTTLPLMFRSLKVNVSFEVPQKK